MIKQTTNHILMVEPVAFGFNEETAVNNYFQRRIAVEEKTVQSQALKEFRGMVDQLRANGIDVVVVQDTLVPHTPDSIFPNNWISFHDDGTVVLYPMYAENRRAERREDILQRIEAEGFIIKYKIDLTPFEQENRFLEGTGGIVLDHVNRYAFSALSQRADEYLLRRFCGEQFFAPFPFHAYQTVDGQRLPIYHTNVMMCVATNYAVICLDSIDDPEEREYLRRIFRRKRKKVISITEEQMHCFAGNMLQVENEEGELFLVMSQSAYDCLDKKQLKELTARNTLLPVSIPTIEAVGGGSARCMMAEIFLKKKNKI